MRLDDGIIDEKTCEKTTARPRYEMCENLRARLHAVVAGHFDPDADIAGMCPSRRARSRGGMPRG